MHYTLQLTPPLTHTTTKRARSICRACCVHPVTGMCWLHIGLGLTMRATRMVLQAIRWPPS
jgi:hypothetical protein